MFNFCYLRFPGSAVASLIPRIETTPIFKVQLQQGFATGENYKFALQKDEGTHRDDGMAASFWPAIDMLTDLGLVERVGMLLDGDDDEAEIIHP